MNKIHFILILIIYSSCGSHYLPKAYEKQVSKRDTTITISTNLASDSFEIQYLGCGGLNIKKGKDHILVDPFFSNQTVSTIIKSKSIFSDTNIINSAFGKIDYKDAQACLITHAHYDHLLDVPYISKKYFNHQLQVYGSKTTINTLIASKLDSSYLHKTEPFAANQMNIGKWIYTSTDSTCRFMPVEYEHAPHFKMGFFTLKFYKGDYNLPPQDLSKADEWLEGKTYSYIIDFLKNGKVDKRIYVLSGGAANPNIGFVSQIEGLKETSIDLMVLCVASHANVKNYPQAIIEAHTPSYVLGVHWEDFFVQYASEKHNKAVRMTNVPKFFDKINGLKKSPKFLISKPLTRFTFRY